MYTTPEQVQMYRRDSSPADWDTQPDTTEFLPLLAETAQQLAVDYEAGKFVNFRPYTTNSSGTYLEAIE